MHVRRSREPNNTYGTSFRRSNAGSGSTSASNGFPRHVLTEETQQGPWFLEELGRKHPGALYRYHQEWVERLARAAEAEETSKAS
jgi:hypothetical protein